jgi:hypothetical protein
MTVDDFLARIDVVQRRQRRTRLPMSVVAGEFVHLVEEFFGKKCV